jgi:hypothetical protein
MKPELRVIKRIMMAYLALLVFNSLLIWFADFHFYGLLSFLVSLWSIEQIFKLNKMNNNPCTSWREFWSITRSFNSRGKPSKPEESANDA